ncbi:tRNA lysidine(34) synthetase TilS [Pseudomarimonas salicorniae]|uniref:tRNA(Ile)-lysidine synthase n=1 Tax=Pseudomarimonas salicorniae TaxID=2933270 RepID=A0ABT0GDI3_9GAMM|nr:tRNA lysidine(34) synthetase TilS [Lysobacter sp. CAU 1642]MCK7592616.1 tRNA lysidine(34) synthetase TilS [Lysobacter sp. CAU 1642]
MDCPVTQALAEWPADTLAVGFSGGLDSSVLLHALARQRRGGLLALHVDHGLQTASRDWARHCLDTARHWGVDCRNLHAEIASGDPRGLEAAAREARYQALAAALPPGAWLALAHHRDDQAETVLLRLLRRAGARGLGGMRETSDSASGLRLWRPFLGLPRAALVDYAQRHGLAFIEDPMNADGRFDRVYLRHQVLPALARRWPQAAEALASSAALLAAEDERRQAAVQDALARCRGLDPACLLLGPLMDESEPLRRPLIEAWCQQQGAPALPGALVERLARGLPRREPRGFASLVWQGWRIERYRGALHIEAERPTGFVARPWDGRASLQLGHGRLALIGAEALPWPVSVAPRRGGEQMRLPGRAHRHALKDCLQSLGLPPWERRGLPLLLGADAELDAAGDLLYSARFEDWLNERGARLRWIPG